MVTVSPDRFSRLLWVLLLTLGLGVVVMGALGSHLFSVVNTGQYNLAREMHALHVLLGLIVLVSPKLFRPQLSRLIVCLLIAGILLFSGNLYLKSTGMDILPRLIPAGGMLLMAAWVTAIVAVLYKPETQ